MIKAYPPVFDVENGNSRHVTMRDIPLMDDNEEEDDNNIVEVPAYQHKYQGRTGGPNVFVRIGRYVDQSTFSALFPISVMSFVLCALILVIILMRSYWTGKTVDVVLLDDEEKNYANSVFTLTPPQAPVLPITAPVLASSPPPYPVPARVIMPPKRRV